MRHAAWSLLTIIVVAALAAPWLAPNPPNRRFDDLLYAPPTRIHIFTDGVSAPFINRWRIVSRIERRFDAMEDRLRRALDDATRRTVIAVIGLYILIGAIVVWALWWLL